MVIEDDARMERRMAERHRQARMHDDDATFEELIAALADIVPDEPLSPDEFLREDEFVCHACWMIRHRSQLEDARHVLCRTCVAAAARR